MKVSARNQYPATVRAVISGQVMSEVVVELDGGQELVAAITAEISPPAGPGSGHQGDCPDQVDRGPPGRRRLIERSVVLEPVTYRPIGRIRTPFVSLDGMPIQASVATGAEGTIELEPALVDGLLDLEGFSHLILVSHLHAMTGARLVVTPFLDNQPHGVFATRSPARPNPIGISVVRLVRVDGGRIHVLDVDLLDETPLLDIKPYLPAFDDRPGARIGWFEGRLDRLSAVRSDRAVQ